MHKKLKNRFAHLQNLLGQYDQEIQNISHEDANKVPPTGGWTIAEVVYHMTVVEKRIIQYIQRKLEKPSESKNAGIRSFYRAALLRYALRSKRKFRAPKVLDNPQGPYDTAQLMNEWRSSRAILEKMFNEVADADIGRELFKHPVVGKINLKQTLGFMADHKQRHLQQIREIKAQIK